MTDAIKEYWDNAHVANVTSKLSGNGKETLCLLGVEREFRECSSLLNIGVGTGEFEKFAVNENRIVDALDISENALEKVANIVRFRYLSPDAIASNEYDLITECQVALHLTDKEMDRHIINAIRGLTICGTYAFNAPAFLEYTEETSKLRAKEDPTVPEMFCGYALCRPISWYAKTIRKHGGIITQVILADVNKTKNVCTYIYHVQTRK